MINMHLSLDHEDYRDIQQAIAKRQTWRNETGCILPDSQSDRAGLLLAEICRGWMDGRTDSNTEGEEWKR